MENRVIKFRAWDAKFGVMLDEIVVYSNNCIAVPDVTVNESYGDRLDERLDDDDTDSPGPEWYLITGGIEVMQFTGLKDKNGIEIYEGDILREPAKGQWEETNFIAYEIFWHDNDCCEHNVGFQLNRMHFYGAVGGGILFFKFKPKDTAKLIVIGNIYQNPELIKRS